MAFCPLTQQGFPIWTPWVLIVAATKVWHVIVAQLVTDQQREGTFVPCSFRSFTLNASFVFHVCSVHIAVAHEVLVFATSAQSHEIEQLGLVCNRRHTHNLTRCTHDWQDVEACVLEQIEIALLFLPKHVGFPHAADRELFPAGSTGEISNGTAWSLTREFSRTKIFQVCSIRLRLTLHRKFFCSWMAKRMLLI